MSLKTLKSLRSANAPFNLKTLNIKHLCVGDSDAPDWSKFGKMLPQEARRQQGKCDIGHINDDFLENDEKSWRKIWKFQISPPKFASVNYSTRYCSKL